LPPATPCSARSSWPRRVSTWSHVSEGRRGLEGSSGAALSTDDRIRGGGGNDWFWPGVGQDRIRGQEDNDHIYARDGWADLVYGGSGLDWAKVDPRLDRVSGIETRR
jgi:Ca2+-binding RTX toxin-like protein